ncbi:MAG: putative lipid II flippase FtsW [Christensenellaceae bacterium]|nr:putative lipid II flippase FtsW [Christensenellaceae bacterium]
MLKVSEATASPKKTKKIAKKARVVKPQRKLDYEKILARFSRVKPQYMNLGLLVPVLCIALFGLAMVYSASWYNSTIYYGTKFYYFTNQAIGFILGAILLATAYLVDYKIYKKFYIAIYALGAVLLTLVFIPGLGITRLGSSRWIGVGGFTMQPSEIAKYSFVVFAAAIACQKRDRLSIKKSMLILGAGLSYCGLILLEPNLSITLVLGMTTFVVLFLFGAKIKHLMVMIAPALVALPVMLIAEPYRVRRLLAFVDPWAHPKDEGFQLIQSLFGLGNGGFFGVGYGNSTQKHMFLPFSESDFIFSIIGEEFGFIGSIIFMAMLAFIIWQIFKTGRRCNDYFGKYLCFGIGTVIFIQSVVNLAVVTGTIPPTGVPLPFISFGGTSLAVCMASVGIVLNVEKNNRRQSP